MGRTTTATTGPVRPTGPTVPAGRGGRPTGPTAATLPRVSTEKGTERSTGPTGPTIGDTGSTTPGGNIGHRLPTGSAVLCGVSRRDATTTGPTGTAEHGRTTGATSGPVATVTTGSTTPLRIAIDGGNTCALCALATEGGAATCRGRFRPRGGRGATVAAVAGPGTRPTTTSKRESVHGYVTARRSRRRGTISRPPGSTRARCSDGDRHRGREHGSGVGAGNKRTTAATVSARLLTGPA